MRASLFFERCGDILVPLTLVLFVFFTPISPSVKSIIFVWTLATIMLTPSCRKHLVLAYHSLWSYSAHALFFFIVLACLWSSAPEDYQLSILWKYSKLLFLPFFAVGFINSRTRMMAINSYLAAIFITCIVALLKSKGVIQLHDWDSGGVFYNHIITGFMVGFGSYLSGLMAFKNKGWCRRAYVFLWFLTSVQVLFINNGRTAYLLYVVLMILLIVQMFSLKQALIALLLFSSAFGLCFKYSPVMQDGFQYFNKELLLLKQNKIDSSLGKRLQFHLYSHSLFIQHPIGGIGTGSFKYQFYQDNPVPIWGKEITEPHSQYWMTLVEQGLTGFILLLFFLGSLFYAALQLKETRPILLGMLIAFCIGSFTDTLLCFSAVGYLLIIFSALCFGELIEIKASQVFRFKVKTKENLDYAKLHQGFPL